MSAARDLGLAIGLASRTGRRERNEDFVIACEASREERITHGAMVALADGIGGAKGGRVAAELACRSFADAYFALPPTLGIATAADRALSGFNRWLHGMARADPTLTGAGTTFTAFVLRGREGHVVHVGDSRAWRLRGGELALLSEDHSLPQPEHRHILYRAVGLEPTVRLDHSVHPLELHDRLLLTSDGIHDVLANAAIGQLLDRRGPPHRDAEALVEAALAAGSRDNVTAAVIDIVALPDPDHAGLAALAAILPIGALPNVGDSVDGFRLERELARGEQARSFVARQTRDGRLFVLKFPDPGVVGEDRAREAFTRERLIGAQCNSPHLAEIVELPADAQSRVYTVMPFYTGETLEARLRRGLLDFPDGLDIAVKIGRGVAALHRGGIVHRDITPANILVSPNGDVRLLDFGFASIPGLEDGAGRDLPGTQGYVAPELYRGEPATAASDQFAFGVTLYGIFTGHFPFSDLRSFHRPGFDSAADPLQWRTDMPAWLALAMRRAVQVAPEDRFGDMLELVHVLEKGSARAVPRPRPASLAERNPLLLWQGIALLLFLALVAALVLR